MEREPEKKKVQWNNNIEWKWTNGEKCEKSPRIFKRAFTQTQIDYGDEDQGKIAQLAYQQALLSENDVWSLEEQQVFVVQNKREDTYNRMAEREMVGQIGMNPFMNRNYLEDVMVQENFLKPVSTSIEREKTVDSGNFN